MPGALGKRPPSWDALASPCGSVRRRLHLAIAHKILVIVYHLLMLGTSYEEARYDQYNPRQEARNGNGLSKPSNALAIRSSLSVPRNCWAGVASGPYLIGLPDVPKKRQNLNGSGASTPSQLFRRNPLECA